MFKRIRNFYRRNRIYCILMLVSFICLVVLGTSLVLYFYNQAISDPYGTRTQSIDKYPVKDEIKKAEEFLEGKKEKDGVLDYKVRVQGNIIYIDVTVDAKLLVEDMQNLGVESLENFTEEQLSYYDLQFTFVRDGYPAYTGSKSAQNTVITWSVYNLDYDKDDTTTTKKTTTKKTTTKKK